ncbi:MAG: hypothetical protein H5T86_14180 [Armatimonadetes bacterium]|nr:hypothetical protein [Armatimonadota bacterium]
MRALAAGLVTLFFVTLGACQEPTQRVAVTDLGRNTRTTGYPGHESHKGITHDIILDNEIIKYAIRYTVCADQSHAPRVVPLEGYVGMPGPCACNWYHSGFLQIIVNGEDVGTYPLGDFSAIDSGERGMCRMVWEWPGGVVRLSFVLDPGKRYLKSQILIRPSGDVKSISLRLRCYPSFFTAYHRREGKREIVTPELVVNQGEDKTLPGEKGWWALYQDAVFDVARGEGEGPCGLVFLPAQVESVRFRPGSYAVETELAVKPSERDIRLGLMEFPGVPNADALKFLKDSAAEILADLTVTDFRPRLLWAINLDEEARELESLIAKANLGGEEAAKFRNMLAEDRKAAEAALAGDWRAETQVAKSLEQYRDALWELKIAALFAE